MIESMDRIPIVGVMGSGRDKLVDDRPQRLGRILAGFRVHLLTGGGRGAMTAVSEAFATAPGREGMVIGVLPASSPTSGATAKGYPNEWVEIAIRTHLHKKGKYGADALSRNHINVLSSKVVVALAGGAGTLTEVELAVTYGVYVIAFLGSRDDLPGLPRVVPVVSEDEEVQALLNRAL